MSIDFTCTYAPTWIKIHQHNSEMTPCTTYLGIWYSFSTLLILQFEPYIALCTQHLITVILPEHNRGFGKVEWCFTPTVPSHVRGNIPWLKLPGYGRGNIPCQPARLPRDNKDKIPLPLLTWNPPKWSIPALF